MSGSEVGNDNGEIVGFGVNDGFTKKLGKSKGQNLSRLGKSLPKSGNSPNFSATEAGPSFLIPGAMEIFNRLWLAFTKALILRHCDPKCHIRIRNNVLGYAISSMLSQLASKTKPDGIVTKTNLGQWHLVVFFSRKMILAETRYKIHDGKLLAIVKTFKIWGHYLESCKHNGLIFTDHNNLRHFMDTKSLSFW